MVLLIGRATRECTSTFVGPSLRFGCSTTITCPYVNFLPEIIIIVLDSALTQFHQILTSLCNPKLKLDFVTIPDDEDFQGTADALRHIKDKIEVCALISVWQVYRNSVFQDGL